MAFVIGFGGGMPLAIGLSRWYDSRQPQARPTDGTQVDDEEALAELRERYAHGELTDEEFEARVSRLLKTESVADAQAYIDRVRNQDPADGSASSPETAADDK